MREPTQEQIERRVYDLWQQAGFAGVIRKKLKLTFISEAAEGGRIYKVIRKTASAVPTGSRPDKAAA
jgi:hypothetical protein